MRTLALTAAPALCSGYTSDARPRVQPALSRREAAFLRPGRSGVRPEFMPDCALCAARCCAVENWTFVDHRCPLPCWPSWRICTDCAAGLPFRLGGGAGRQAPFPDRLRCPSPVVSWPVCFLVAMPSAQAPDRDRPTALARYTLSPLVDIIVFVDAFYWLFWKHVGRIVRFKFETPLRRILF